jgi:hypothetical protein
VATLLTREELRRLARLGALRRLEEIRQEEAAIRAAFPDLRDDGTTRPGRRRGRPPGSSTTATSDGRSSARRRRRKMTPAEKRAVSERMKKYWATRRKAR